MKKYGALAKVSERLLDRCGSLKLMNDTAAYSVAAPACRHVAQDQSMRGRSR
jgi:hypothetical protein